MRPINLRIPIVTSGFNRYANKTGWGLRFDSTAPGTVVTPTERVASLFSITSTVTGGIESNTVAYWKFYSPIQPGDIVNIPVSLQFTRSTDSVFRCKLTLMTSPDYDPYTLTYATRPTIDPADQNIYQDIPAGVFPDINSIVKIINFDLSAQTLPIIGMAAEVNWSGGAGSNGRTVSIAIDIPHFMSVKPPNSVSVIARESYMSGGQSYRKLYLAPGAAADKFMSAYSTKILRKIGVIGVGDGSIEKFQGAAALYYPSGPLTDATNMYDSFFPYTNVIEFNMFDVNAGGNWISYLRPDGYNAFTEAQTDCGGNVLVDL